MTEPQCSKPSGPGRITMALLTALYKTLIFLTVSSFFVFFYTFKMKEEGFLLREEKSELEEENREFEEKNSSLSKENPQKNQQLLSMGETSRLNEENPKLKKKVQELEEKIQELNDKNQESKVKDPESVQKIQELEEKMRELDEKYAKLNEKNAELEANNPELEKKNLKLEGKIQDLEKKMHVLNEKSAKLNEKNAELEEKNPELENENSELENKIQELENKMRELSEKSAKLKEKKPELEKSDPEPEEEKAKVEENSPELEEDYSKLEEKKTELVKEKAELENEKEELENEKEELKDNKYSELEKEKPELVKEKPELEENNSEQEKEEAEPEEKNSELEEEKAGLKEEFCEPKTNILFLKTHKTASTTLMKYFHRFAVNHQLIVASKVNPRKISKFHRCSIYPLKAGYEYNIFTHHTMFNYEEMKDLMPNDTVFLTILRDPVAQFESEYGYFGLQDVYGMSINEFADLDTSLPKWSKVKNLRRDGKNGRNPNCYDLGIDPELFDDEEAILEKVRELDQQFDLVMITELFDQSMILMKDRLCWEELSDVTGVKSNVRIPEVKARLSAEQKRKLREKNRADQIMYDYFHQKFLRQIDAFGKEKMEEEVEKLRALTAEINEVCVEYANTGSLDNPKSKVTTRLKAGAEKHQVCRSVIKDQRTANWRKFSESKFKKAVKCED